MKFFNHRLIPLHMNEEEGGGGGGGGETWHAQLPEDMRDNETLAQFKDEEGMIPMPVSVAKSYIHSRSLIGADTYKMPTSDEDWSEHYTRLGRPETSDLYVLQAPDGVPPEMQEVLKDEGEWFRKTAHELGFTDKQASEWYRRSVERQTEKLGGMQKSTADIALNTEVQLRTEFGPSYDGKKVLMDRALEKLGGTEFMELINGAGVAANPVFQRAMFKVGGMMAEDLGLDKATGEMIMSNETLEGEIKSLMANPGYLDASHAEHTVLVNKVQQLMKKQVGNVPVAPTAGTMAA